MKNPKLSTLQIIKSFTQEETIKNEESEKIILNDEHPLRTPEQVKNKYVKKTDKELNVMSESLKLDLQRYGIEPEYKNRYSISLNYIIKELEKNDINVILFTHPHHKYYLESVPKQSEENFLKIIHNLRDNHDIKLVKVKGEFILHKHDETDEVFIILEGVLKIKFKDKIQIINKGEMIVIPHGENHKPFCDEECKILIIERKNTFNTGNEFNDLTSPNNIWI